MKAFLAAICALVIITVGADVLLSHAGYSAAEKFQKQDVRLGD